MVDTVNQNFIYSSQFIHFLSTLKEHDLSVSNDGIDWSLDFGPHSVTLTVNDLVHETLHEIWDEVLSSVGAPEGPDTTGYRVSADLDDVEFYWENDQPDIDAVFRQGIDTTFSPTAFDDLEMGGGSAKNPILLDEEEDKETSPPTTTPVSERPNRPPAILRNCPFATRTENVPDYVYRILFQ